VAFIATRVNNRPLSPIQPQVSREKNTARDTRVRPGQLRGVPRYCCARARTRGNRCTTTRRNRIVWARSEIYHVPSAGERGTPRHIAVRGGKAPTSELGERIIPPSSYSYLSVYFFFCTRTYAKVRTLNARERARTWTRIRVKGRP